MSAINTRAHGNNSKRDLQKKASRIIVKLV